MTCPPPPARRRPGWSGSCAPSTPTSRAAAATRARPSRSAPAIHGAGRPGPAGPAPGQHHDRDLGDRLPSGLSLAGGSRPGPARRDPPPPGHDRHPRPLRPRSEVSPPAQLQLRRWRGTRRPLRGCPPHQADGLPGVRRHPSRPDRLTRPSTENTMPTPNGQHYDVIIAGARSRVPPPRCCWPGREPGYCCWTGPGTAPTPCRPTRSCAARSCNCTGGDCFPGSSPREHRRSGQRPSTCRPLSRPWRSSPGDGVDALYAPRRVARRDPRRRRPQRRGGAAIRHLGHRPAARQDRAGNGDRQPAGAAHLEISADLVIGADGRRSTIARCPEPGPPTSPRPRAPLSTGISATPRSRATTGTTQLGKPPALSQPTTG